MKYILTTAAILLSTATASFAGYGADLRASIDSVNASQWSAVRGDIDTALHSSGCTAARAANSAADKLQTMSDTLSSDAGRLEAWEGNRDSWLRNNHDASAAERSFAYNDLFDSGDKARDIRNEHVPYLQGEIGKFINISNLEQLGITDRGVVYDKCPNVEG